MSKQHSIRITDNDKETFRKASRSIVNKKSKVKTKFGIELDVHTKKLEDIKTRTEFNAYVKQAKKLADRKTARYIKNENGVVMPYELVKKTKDTIRKATKIKTRFLEKVKGETFTDRGVPQGVTVGDSIMKMGDTRYKGLGITKWNPDRFRNQSEFIKYVEHVEKTYDNDDFITKQNKRYRKSYIKAMKSELGKKSLGLQKHIREMPLEEFMKIYYKENMASIGFIYDYESRQAKIETLKGIYGVGE